MAFDRKYKLLKRDVTYVNIHHQTIKLYRIMALKRIVLCNGEVIDEGMLGGYIQKEENLSQIGTCWVGYGATVCGDSHVADSSYISNSHVEDSDICGGSKVIGSHIQGSIIVHSMIENSAVYFSDVYDCSMKNDVHVENAKAISSILLDGARIGCGNEDQFVIGSIEKITLSNCFLSIGAVVQSNSDYANIQYNGIGITLYKNKNSLSDMYCNYMYCFKYGNNISCGVTEELEKMLHEYTDFTAPMIGYIAELAYYSAYAIKQAEKELDNKHAKDIFSGRISDAMKSIEGKELESIAEEIMTIAKDYVHTKEVGNDDKKVQKV